MSGLGLLPGRQDREGEEQRVRRWMCEQEDGEMKQQEEEVGKRGDVETRAVQLLSRAES